MDTALALIWTMVCVVGGAYSIDNFIDARRDAAALKAMHIDGVLKIIAGGNIRRERTRLIFWVIAFIVGVAALVGATGPWVGFALIGVMGLNAYNSQQDRKERRAVRELPERKP